MSPSSPRVLGPGEDLIVLDGVSRTYPGPPCVEALRATSLVVTKGSYVAIVGTSGSGKSTLLHLLGLLDLPTAGCYRLAGQDVGKLGDEERTALRAHSIGFIFQAFHLLPHYSAVENAGLSLLYRAMSRHERRRRALEAIARVGMSHRASAAASTLSGGERQRVAIARALAAEPAMLLCDEPTGNLDSANTTMFLDLVAALHADGLTVLVVTHDREVARRAQWVVEARDGVVGPLLPAGTA